MVRARAMASAPTGGWAVVAGGQLEAWEPTRRLAAERAAGMPPGADSRALVPLRRVDPAAWAAFCRREPREADRALLYEAWAVPLRPPRVSRTRPAHPRSRSHSRRTGPGAGA